MADQEWTALGHQQEATPHRQLLAERKFDEAYSYAVKSQTHLWIITVAHRASDSVLDAYDGEGGTPILDVDTILMRPTVGCYVCEEVYEPRMRRRRCLGEPRS